MYKVPGTCTMLGKGTYIENFYWMLLFLQHKAMQPQKNTSTTNGIKTIIGKFRKVVLKNV